MRYRKPSPNSTPMMEASMKADELWDKYAYRSDSPPHITYTQFLAALAEYGQAVRDRDAEICKGKIDPEWPNDDISNMASDCAAAISREPLP